MTLRPLSPFFQFLAFTLGGAILSVPYCGIAPIVAWAFTVICLCKVHHLLK